MTYPVTKPPKGLLDAMGLASMGEAPRALETAFRGVIDVSSMFYFTEYRNTETTPAATAPVAGFNPLLLVGQNNMLIPVHGGVFITLEAGRTAQVSLATRTTGISGSQRVAPLSAPVQATAGVLARAHFNTGTPIWLQSGIELGLLLENVTGGAPTVATTYGIALGNVVLRAGA